MDEAAVHTREVASDGGALLWATLEEAVHQRLEGLSGSPVGVRQPLRRGDRPLQGKL